MLITGSTLFGLCRKFSYDISDESNLVFAIRGCLPLQLVETDPSGAGIPAKIKGITRRQIDYKEASCTIGLWNCATGDLALFPGSTVPSLHYLHAHPASDKHFNILCPGKYKLVRGIHPRKKSGYQRHNALIMPGTGWIMRPARIRKKVQTTFDFGSVEYRVAYPGDSLHASRTEPHTVTLESGVITVMSRSFSSSGCLTILGQPAQYVNGEYPFFWNAWEQFMQLLTTSFSGSACTLLLFDYSDFVDSADDNAHGNLRYGSSGIHVEELQLKLSEIISSGENRQYYSGKITGLIEGETADAYLRFMYDYSPGHVTGEVRFEKFRSLTGHFLFKHKHYRHVIN